jgi:hypothetical protein
MQLDPVSGHLAPEECLGWIGSMCASFLIQFCDDAVWCTKLVSSKVRFAIILVFFIFYWMHFVNNFGSKSAQDRCKTGQRSPSRASKTQRAALAETKTCIGFQCFWGPEVSQETCRRLKKPPKRHSKCSKTLSKRDPQMDPAIIVFGQLLDRFWDQLLELEFAPTLVQDRFHS